VVDVVFVLVILGFFGLCVLYVRACDRLVGPDGPDGVDGTDGVLEERREVAV
jgi:hypothetical protein